MLVLGTQNNICVLLLSICVRINFWGWKIPISALVLPVFWAFPVLGPIITSLASSRSNTDGPFGPEMPKKRVKRGGNGYFHPQKWIHTKIEKSSTHNCLIQNHMFFKICFRSILHIPEFSFRISLRIFYFELFVSVLYGLWEFFVITQEKKLVLRIWHQ